MQKILIICNENILRQYKIDLESLGHLVIPTSSPEEGEEKIKTEKPDLIIWDTQTPETDEIGFLETCRTKYQDIPMILCTPHGNAKQDFHIWASHAHVIKSANSEELKIAVKATLT